MTAIEVRSQIVEGKPFAFASLSKRDRIYYISAIIRPAAGNLFLINASDSKRS